jgi:hypothetical protein
MKKLLAVLFVGVLAFGLGAGSAQAISLTVGDAYYLGRVIDGVPSNPANEVRYINSLTGLIAGAGAVACSLEPTEDCDRLSSTVAGPFAVATEVGSFKNDSTPLSGVNATGWVYVIGKYGSGSSGGGEYVWFINGAISGTITLPSTFAPGGPGLSHISLYNKTTVPDGGATLMLLGGALVGLGALRRKLGA